MSNNIVEIKQLNIQYPTNKDYSLKIDELKIKRGEVVLITGKSGAGKTTLCNVLNGVIPNLINAELSGDILFNDENLMDQDFLDIGQNIGTVFQHPKLQFFTNTVDAEIRFAAENYCVDARIIGERKARALDTFDLSDKRDDKLDCLSAGQQQAVAVSTIYTLDPDLYILDEPTANLDSQGVAILLKFIREQRKLGKTVIVSDHRIAHILETIDRVLYLDRGKLDTVYSLEEFKRIHDRKRKEMGLRSLVPLQLQIQDKQKSSESFLVKNICNIPNKNVDFTGEVIEIEKGKITGIYGENGIGKTTLLKCLYGMHENSSDLYFKGEKLEKKVRRKDSYIVFQNSNRQFYKETVREEILSVADLSEEDLLKTLSCAGIDQYCDTHPITLSGGERQRLSILVALLSKRKYLYLDEITSGLDYGNMAMVSKLLKSYCSKEGFIVTVSHDVEFLNSVCDNIIDLDKFLQDEGCKTSMY
ncbi:MAG: ATP-binding cassette domain-containing protein [Eubacteriaceae bacterium]|nr:ATP-binding cassette domain-containing protein [Eubacteriaceae bacterium]